MKLFQQLDRSFSFSSCTKHNCHCVIGFLINAALLNVYFILHYHLFFGKEIYFSECSYSSEYNIRMYSYVLVEKGAINFVLTQLFGDGRGSSKMRAATCRGRGCHSSCVRTHFSFHIFGKSNNIQ